MPFSSFLAHFHFVLWNVKFLSYCNSNNMNNNNIDKTRVWKNTVCTTWCVKEKDSRSSAARLKTPGTDHRVVVHSSFYTPMYTTVVAGNLQLQIIFGFSIQFSPKCYPNFHSIVLQITIAPHSMYSIMFPVRLELRK